MGNQQTKPDQLSNSAKTGVLTISGKKLKSVKTELVAQIKDNLRVLDVSNNALESIERLMLCTKLQRLDAGYNKIVSIPQNIGSLSSLTKLVLDSNQISVIPSELGKLSKLKHLSLKANRIETLPTELGELKELEFLGLKQNRLTSVPDSLAGLDFLLELDLSLNQMSHINSSLAQCSRLKVLRMDGNKLTHTPDSIPDLILARSKISTLGIDGNSGIDHKALRNRDAHDVYLQRFTKAQNKAL
eukprot:Clim_evm8s200 gene=Clim_evmTU8s200